MAIPDDPVLVQFPPLASDPINHPSHYTFGAIEVIDAIEAWGLGFHLGNVVKYVARADQKGNRLSDLKKARWYLDREVRRMEVDEEEEVEEDESHICPYCGGTGTSRSSNRPDDYGPHTICYSCRGTGIVRSDQDE
jgi:DnaJ-class molecular chaperone